MIQFKTLKKFNLLQGLIKRFRLKTINQDLRNSITINRTARFT